MDIPVDLIPGWLYLPFSSTTTVITATVKAAMITSSNTGITIATIICSCDVLTVVVDSINNHFIYNVYTILLTFWFNDFNFNSSLNSR